MKHKNVKYHADPTALSILKTNAEVSIVQEQQLRQEWGSLDLNVVIVKDIQQAITHIN